MKNQFNKTQSNLEQKRSYALNQNSKKRKVTQELRIQIERTQNLINKNLKQVNQREQNFKKDYVEKCKEAFLQKQLLQKADQKYKALSKKYRKLNEQMQNINRMNQKQSIAVLPKDSVKTSSLTKLKNMIQEQQTKIKQLQKQLNDMGEQGDQNPIIKKLQNDNNQLKKKILYLEKEINVEKNKMSQQKYVLDQRNKERENEGEQKRQLQIKLAYLKQLINQENMINQEVIAARVRQKQAGDLDQYGRRHKNIDKYYNVYSKRIADFQQKTTNLIEQKTDQTQDLADQNSNQNYLLAKLGQKEKEYYNLITNLEGEKQKNKIYKRQFDPLQKSNEKYKQRANQFNQQTTRILKQIQTFQKQLQLIKLLKGLNLENIQTIKSNNQQIQSNITTFIKKWQNIQNKL